MREWLENETRVRNVAWGVKYTHLIQQFSEYETQFLKEKLLI